MRGVLAAVIVWLPLVFGPGRASVRGGAEWGLYRSRPLVVEAMQSEQWSVVPTVGGYKKIGPGEWLVLVVRDAKSEYHILSDADFCWGYEAIE